MDRAFVRLLPWARHGIRMLEREANGLDPYGNGGWVDTDDQPTR